MSTTKADPENDPTDAQLRELLNALDERSLAATKTQSENSNLLRKLLEFCAQLLAENASQQHEMAEIRRDHATLVSRLDRLSSVLEKL
jgi:hypothetical protein